MSYIPSSNIEQLLEETIFIKAKEVERKYILIYQETVFNVMLPFAKIGDDDTVLMLVYRGGGFIYLTIRPY